MVFGAKAKGRNLQKKIVQLISTYFGLLSGEGEDIRSTPMGSGGPDVLYQTREAQATLGFSVECSNSEKFSLAKLEQGYNNGIDKKHNDKKRWPVLFYKKNGWRPVAILDAETFMDLSCRLKSMDGIGIYEPRLMGGARKKK